MHFSIYILIAVISFLFVLACRYMVRRVLGRNSCCGGSCCTGGDSCPVCTARKRQREEERKKKP